MERTPIVIIGALILIFVAVASLITRFRKPPIKISETPKQEEPETKARKRVAFGDENYLQKLKANAVASFEETRTQALRVGSTHYTWRSCGDQAVCIVCSKNNGRKFKWNHPHHHGHPGSGCRSNNGHCRCYAEPVIPA